ncbi:MAG: hypothetical protein JWQ11_4582 [Rhizobacter sp.]|nr:hypothetical protein [Rhizobacter sp.]
MTMNDHTQLTSAEAALDRPVMERMPHRSWRNSGTSSRGATSLALSAAVALVTWSLTACGPSVPAGSGGMADSAASSAPKMAPPKAAGSAPSAP